MPGGAQTSADGERLVTRTMVGHRRRPCVVTMGVFDGVHQGHRALVRTARRHADARGLPLVAVTFAPRPEQVLLPGPARPDLCSLRTRIARLREAGAGEVIVLPFTRTVASITADRFARLLIDELGLRLLCVGEDFALGRGRAGNAVTLRSFGLDVITVPLVLGADGHKVSSSAARSAVALECGRVAA